MSGLEFFGLYILTTLSCFLLNRGQPDQGDSAPFFVIPGLNVIALFICLIVFVSRIHQSKGKCILGHEYKLVYDSESEKWKNGRMPMRISVGGHSDYQCSRCSHKTTTTWSAF